MYLTSYAIQQLIQISMSTVEQILAEEDNISTLSVTPSFTLEDILQEPPDEDLYEVQIDEENIDAFFEDDEPSSTQSPILPYDMNQQSADLSASIQHTELSKRITQHSQLSYSKVNQPLRRFSRIADLPITPFEQIKNMIYTSLKNVSKLFNTKEVSGVGIPTCISGTGSKFLALGTSLGNIALFQIEVPGFRKLGQSDKNKYGQVTSVSISRDNRYLVGGYQTGMVIIWDLYTLKVVKEQRVYVCRIIKVLFCSQSYENFVVIDEKGFAYLYTIESYFWVVINRKQLVDHSGILYYDVKYNKLQSGRQILALCSLDYVLLLSLKPEIGIIDKIERPESLSSNKIPNCEVGKSQTDSTHKGYDILCISWGNLIFVYRFLPSNHSMEQLLHHFTITHPASIHNMQLITNGMLVTIDEHQKFRVINLEESLMNDKCFLISIDEMESEIMYQRYLKDRKGKNIKLYSNTVVNCSFYHKHKEIFFISKDAVYRGRLQKWTDYIYKLIKEQRNWSQTLKLCLELYANKFNIFAEPFIINKVTIELLCDIGRIFLKEQLKELQRINEVQTSIDQVRIQTQELFDMVIEYFLKIKCEDYLFGQIIPLVRMNYFYQYEEEFIRSFESFIEKGMVHQITDHQSFLKIISQFERKPELINKLVLSLEEDSLYYEDTVELCTKLKLYPSLAYICSVHGDFISPATKILNHCQEAKLLHYDNAVQQTYLYLQEYLNSVLDLKYPSAKERTLTIEHRTLALSKLSIWITYEQTIKFLISQSATDFYHILNKLTTVLLELNYEQSVHQILQELIKIKGEQMGIGGYLLGICHKIKLKHEQIQYIIANPQVLVSHSDISQSLLFFDHYLYQIQPFMNEQQKISPDLYVFYCILLGRSIDQVPRSNENSKQIVNYLLNNIQYCKLEKYLDLLIKWEAEEILLYMLKMDNIEKVNQKIKEVKDKREKYLIIRKILKIIRTEKSSKKLKDDIMVFYLTSLCQLKKEKRVLVQLIQNISDYAPIIDKILPVIEEYHLQSCLGYLYELQLNYHKAFESYVIVYNEYFKSNFIKLISFQHCHGRFMGKIYERMLELCVNIGEQSQWLKLLSSVLKPLQKEDFTTKKGLIIDRVQKIYDVKSTQNHPFLLELLQIIEVTLINVNREVPMRVLTYELGNHVNLLNKTFILNCLTQTLNNFSKRSETYNISLKMLVQDVVSSFDVVYEENKIRGISVDNECWKCGEKMEENCSLFNCGHGYHRDCLIEKNCGVCLQLQYGDKNKQEDKKERIKRQKKSSYLDVEQSTEESKGVLGTVYKCLAFEDFLGSKEEQFENFRNEYEKHLQTMI